MTTEGILIAIMVVLIIVLALETWEYHKSTRSNEAISRMVESYTLVFNSFAGTTQMLQETQTKIAATQQEVITQLICMKAVLEVHNRALSLSPRLIDTIKDVDISGVITD